MKKFLSVVAILALVLTMAAPAFAADSPTKEPPAKVEGATNEAGENIHVEVVAPDPKDAPTEAQMADAKEEAVKQAGEGATVSEVFEIHEVNDEGAEVNPDGSVTVTLVYNGEGEVAGVLYQNEDGSWDYAAAEKVAGGYKVTFKHFCNAMFVLKEAAASSGTNTNTGDKKPAASTGTASPQTGFDATVWMAAMSALVLCAVLFFRAGRKVTE